MHMRHGKARGMQLTQAFTCVRARCWLPVLALLLLGARLEAADEGTPVLDLASSKVTPWSGDPKVLLVVTAAGLHRAEKAEDLSELIRDNLEPDLAPYSGRPGATARDFDQLLQRIASLARLRRSTVAILVKGQHVTAIKFRQFLPRFEPHVDALVDALQRYGASGQIPLPPTLLLFNTRDEPLCRPMRGKQPCTTLPVFSHHKEWDWRLNSSHHLDVLVPYFIHAQDHLVWYPPADKVPRALLRAGLHQQMNVTCCRYQLALKAATQGANGMLDAGIVTTTWKRPLPFDKVPFVELEAHARWQYLVSCDGNSASARLGKLLATNSVVLKQESPYLEWYYRSLRPGTHYLPFNVSGIMQVLHLCAQLSGMQQAAMQTAANRFAYAYLGPLSRAVFWAEAIRRYNQLFAAGVMHEMLAGLPSDTANMDLMQLLSKQHQAASQTRT